MKASLAVGLLADLSTLIGGILLAWDVVFGGKYHTVRRNVADAIEHGILKDLPVILDNTPVSNVGDVEGVFARRASRKAVWGCVFLVLGFAASLGSRIIEALSD